MIWGGYWTFFFVSPSSKCPTSTTNQNPQTLKPTPPPRPFPPPPKPNTLSAYGLHDILDGAQYYETWEECQQRCCHDEDVAPPVREKGSIGHHTAVTKKKSAGGGGVSQNGIRTISWLVSKGKPKRTPPWYEATVLSCEDIVSTTWMNRASKREASPHGALEASHQGPVPQKARCPFGFLSAIKGGSNHFETRILLSRLPFLQ